jgi:hypothetical protein
MAVALSACLSKVDVLVVKITESVSTYREKHILNFTRLQFLYNDTNSLDHVLGGGCSFSRFPKRLFTFLR